MNTLAAREQNSPLFLEEAKGRLRAVKSEPLVRVEWRRVQFFHYAIEPMALRAQVPGAFEVELHHDSAIVSLVAVTMRHFRPNPAAPVWARLFAMIPEQRFFNLRTYVRHEDDSGAFFFWSWLSQPWGLPLPARPLGLTCDFARSEFHHEPEQGALRGVVRGRGNSGRFAYRARIESGHAFRPAATGSLAEFALERYRGYFWHRGSGRIFHASHPVWLQARCETEIEDDSLVVRAFPWFKQARFIEAHYAPGSDEVGIGQPRRLPTSPRRRCPRHGLSSFFEMP